KTLLGLIQPDGGQAEHDGNAEPEHPRKHVLLGGACQIDSAADDERYGDRKRKRCEHILCDGKQEDGRVNVLTEQLHPSERPPPTTAARDYTASRVAVP